jgi:hypothetical protein
MLIGEFYWNVVKPTVPYGSEYWAGDRRKQQSMSVAYTKMLRWMSEVTKEDRIRDEYTRGRTGLVSIVDKIRENRPRWFRHVMR